MSLLVTDLDEFEIMFQQDGASAYYYFELRRYLDEKYPGDG